MRKATLLLSMIVLAAMVLTACGGGATSTNVAGSPPPVTAAATEAMTATEAPTEAPTMAGTATSEPGVPVTGEANSGRMSDRLQFQVLDQAGNQIGQVSDLVLDLSKARVLYVIVDAGANKVAVPRDLLTVQGSSSTGTGTGSGTDAATSTPAAGGAGTDLSTATPGTGSDSTGTGPSTSTPETGTGPGSAMEQNAFILQADPNMLQNAPAFDDKNMPGLGEAPDSWDISIRKYWQGGGAVSGSNTPSPDGTAVPDSTATATGGTGSGTGTGTGSGTGMGKGAITIQGVVLASKVIGAQVTVAMQTLLPAPGTGTESSTSTPSAGGTGTGSSTSTPRAGTNTDATISGTIDDLIVDGSGNILFIVLRAAFDDGEHLLPVPLSFLQLDSDQTFVLNTDPARLQNAPFFQDGQFPDMTMSGWNSEFDSFWQNNGTGSGSGSNATATAVP